MNTPIDALHDGNVIEISQYNHGMHSGNNKLEISNENCVAYDLIFGCPGWIEGVIQAKSFIISKMAKRCLVIGADTLSRTIDKSDRDSMIFADGAGASIIEENNNLGGILSHKTITKAGKEALYLFCKESYSPKNKESIKPVSYTHLTLPTKA